MNPLESASENSEAHVKRIGSRSTLGRAYDLIFYFYDTLRKKILTLWDDLWLFTARKLGPIVGRALLWLSHVLAFTLERDDGFGFVGRILKVVIGVAIAIPAFFIGLSLILVGGMVAGILGLRNLGEYSLLEELVAWFPLALILVTAPLLVSPYYLGKIGLILSFSVLLIGLDFLFGQCGILTLGHAGFAHTGALLCTFLYNGTFGFKLPFLVATPVSCFGTAALGLLIGLPSLRVKDEYLLIVTMAFGLSISLIFKSQLGKYFGFTMAALDIEQPQFFNILTNVEGATKTYFFILLSTGLLIFFAHNLLRRSQIGRAFRIIKCDKEISMIFGVSVLRYKLLAFSLSAFYAAYAGCMLLVWAKFISLESYSIFSAMEYYVALVIGGVGSILGAVLGGAFLGFEVDITRHLGELIPKGEYLARVFYGVLVILTIFISPRGIASLITNLAMSNLTGVVRRGVHYMMPPSDYSTAANRKSAIKEN